MKTRMWNETVVAVAQCFVEGQSTIREVAKKMHIPKTTVHLKLRELLEHPGVYHKEKELAIEVNKLIAKNKQERHMRGGNKTKQMLAELKEKKLREKIANN